MLGTVPVRRTALGRAVWLVLGATLAACWLLMRPAPHVVNPTFALVLALTAVGAGFASVRVKTSSRRIVLCLPYVAALSLFWSPSAALLVGVICSGISLVLHRQSAKRAQAEVCSQVMGIAFGTLALALVPRGWAGIEWAPIHVLAFMAVFTLVRWRVEHAFHTNSAEGYRMDRSDYYEGLALRLAAFTLLGAVIGVLGRDELTWLVPITLVPVWAFRIGVLRRAQVSQSYYDTVTALTLMLQRAHPYTHAHLSRVALTAELVAQRLGLSARRAELVRAAAVLHDIGKIAVNENILDKPGALTPEERAHVQNHSLWGAQILDPIRQFRDMVPWIRYHHERPDGTGYPERLIDSQIPVESKIIAVVDAFDAMTGGDRSYRAPMTQEEALSELRRCISTQFDGVVVQAFYEVLTEELV